MAKLSEQEIEQYKQMLSSRLIGGWKIQPNDEELNFIKNRLQKSDFYAKMYHDFIQYGLISIGMFVYVLKSMGEASTPAPIDSDLQIGDEITREVTVTGSYEATFTVNYRSQWREDSKNCLIVRDEAGYEYSFFVTVSTQHKQLGDSFTLFAKVKKIGDRRVYLSYAKAI